MLSHQSQIDGKVIRTDYETWKNGVEGSGIKWHHTTWTTHVGLMLYTWSFRVGCTVVSTDYW